MSITPKVSILIPCYNASQWIGKSIASALAQTYPNTEVIVVDDGSTDGSLEIIQQFGDRIHWETQPNRGGNVTRHRLLELSTGEWLQYLDADDYLLPDKIAQQLQSLPSEGIMDVIYSPSRLEYWQNGQPLPTEILAIPQPHDPWTLLARWYLPQTGSALWHKQAIVDVGSWKLDQPCCQEHELYLRLLIADKRFQYCEYAGSVYRQWSESTVCKRDKSETQRRRLDITDRLEQHLAASNGLTQARKDAINQSRFDCARTIWLSQPQWAQQIIQQIHLSDRTFTPRGQSAPHSYRLLYQLFGFSVAETIADLKRNLKPPFWRRNVTEQV
jgi:glycosyltransferase involved in cell wall biosynthesis